MKRGLTLVLSVVFVVASVALAVADDKPACGKSACGTAAGAKSACSKDACAKGECAKGCVAIKTCGLKCPISGKDVCKDASVDYKGGKVFLCCPGCVGKMKGEDAAKYAAKANEQLVQSGQFKQVGCPLSGGKVNPDAKVKVCGVDVAFCCMGCVGKVKDATAEKQCEMVFVKGFDKAFAPNKPKDAKDKTAKK